MKKFNNNSAFTLVELLISLIAGAIIALTIGAISSIALSSHKEVMNEGTIYNDIAYGFKNMQKRVREAQGITVLPADATWQSEHLQIDSTEAFGIPVGTPLQFVRVTNLSSFNCTTLSNCEVIFSVANGDQLVADFTQNGQSVEIQISGKKDEIPFDMSTTMGRRRR